MIDLEKGEKKLDQVDGILTKLTKILKKHWLILLIIGLCVGLYFLFTAESVPAEEFPEEYPEEYYEEDPEYDDYEEPYEGDTYYEQQRKG